MSKDFFPEVTKMSEQKSVCELDSKDYFRGTVKILRRAKPGPVVLTVTDGTCTVDAVTRECEFQVDDVVELAGPVNKHQGRLQVEIKSIKRSDKDFSEILDQKANPVRTEISIESDGLEKLKPYFIKIATRIRRAVLEGQPIMIRHHCDADGITSGIMTEDAIRSFMIRQGVDPQYSLYRSPMRAPFYEVADALKDVSFMKRFLESHGQRKPLMIVMDNGSTPEDVLGHRTCKLFGIEVVVIDHHNPVEQEGKTTAIDPYVSLHCNPYLEGLPGDYNTGMLIHELARMIDEEFENTLLPAVSVLADRSSIPEAKMYIEASGRSEEELIKIGTAIDYLAWNLRHDPGIGIYEQLFKNPEFVSAINEEVTQGIETQLQSTLPHVRSKHVNGVKFSTIDLGQYTMRFTYPTPGKVINLIQDHMVKDHEHEPVLTLGIMPDMIIVRANMPVLPLPRMIKALQEKFPEANVDGGGHDVAGTMKCVEGYRDKVVQFIHEQLKDLDKKVIEECMEA